MIVPPAVLAPAESLADKATVTAEDVLHWLATDGLRIVLTLVTLVVVRFIANRAISTIVDASTKRARDGSRTTAQKMLDNVTGADDERHAARMKTLGSLLRSIVTFVLIVIGVLTVFGVAGIPLGPLLASAGIGGVAIGLGAQSLIKDFLSGIFMIIEDQYGVGDIIDTGEAVGTVEEVTLRVTRLRDTSGVTWYVRNGEIVRVGNTSQGWQAADVDIPIASSEPVDKAIEVIRRAADLAGHDDMHDMLIDDPDVLGVQSVSAAGTIIRTRVRCVPGAAGTVTRRLRAQIKNALDDEGIAGPPPAAASDRPERT